MNDQLLPGACDDGMKSEKRTRNRQRNPPECPECYTVDNECFVNPSYDGDMAYCPDEVGHPDAVADCIATHTYVDLFADGCLRWC